MYATIHFLALSRKHALHDYRPETRSLFATGGGGADVSDLMQTSKQAQEVAGRKQNGASSTPSHIARTAVLHQMRQSCECLKLAARRHSKVSHAVGTL